MVDCPICARPVRERDINAHLDSGCKLHIASQDAKEKSDNVAPFFSSQATRLNVNPPNELSAPATPPAITRTQSKTEGPLTGTKRPHDEPQSPELPSSKKSKISVLDKVAPLADRMRPRSLDDVCGQDLVGPEGVIRGLIEQDRVPSMVLWGGPGTGKTTIARLIAHTSNSRFVEINSTSSGVAECKKLFAQALNELQLTGRKTIIFCDEIHRFSKSQQDVFLGPVEAGLITLIGATTENPSFKVIAALLSRCRVFTLSPLKDADIVAILKRALEAEGLATSQTLLLTSEDMLDYLATSAAGDARTALNLLELSISLSSKTNITFEQLKASLTHTLIYDRQGDAHYDTISALHKSVRGSDPDASLYYLARMLESGEDPLYIARRLIVIASEDVGLADNTMLPLAIATHDAVQKIGLPEARINLGHCVTALALSPKSTRAYRALSKAEAAVRDPATAALPIPLHLRNAPTRLMKEIGYGADYKYNPEYVNGVVKQNYLPERLKDANYLEDRDFGLKVDPDLQKEASQATLSGEPIKEEDDEELEDDTVKSENLDELPGPGIKNEAYSMGLHNVIEAAGPLEELDDQDLWEQDENGLWTVKKSSQMTMDQADG